jgi:hypothetical protein
MSILKNAVESIQIGMEDFHDDDPRRVLSAIRNLYAGILLLLKHKLHQLSPDGTNESLLKSRVLPQLDKETGAIVWSGKSKGTVDVREIQERFDSLGINGITWKHLTQLQDIRNDIEHYYSQLPEARLKEAISNLLHLVMEFCSPHLGKEPVEILGEETWALMLEVGTVYQAELGLCQENLLSVSWPFEEVKDSIQEMRCPECESQLIKVIDVKAKRADIRFLCSNCQEESLYAQIVGPAVSTSMGAENYTRAMDGESGATDCCPECGEDSFLNDLGECAACFYELEYRSCSRCDIGLSLDEQDLDGLCGYCNHVMEKVMAE